MKFIKSYLLVGVAVSALIAGAAWKLAPSYAADEHNHAHEESEEKHDDHGHGGEGSHEEEEGVIRLDEAQLSAAGIEVSPIYAGNLSREVVVPGRVVAAADMMAQIVPKVAGTVVEARKNLGDTVEKGEVLALIESREMAEAVADYLAAKRAGELARTTFNREKTLWDKKVTAEQDYLAARNTHQEAQIRLDLTRQKLQALGHDDATIKKYDGGVSADSLRFHELRSPLAGRVISRELTLGEYVDTTHTAFSVANLGTLWIETAIAPNDLPFVKEGQAATITGGANKAEGKLVFVSPAIDPETRAAKAVIALDNRDGKWRPGEFATAAIATAAQQSGLLVPKDALQIIEGKPTAFARTKEGFEKRVVTTGREDSNMIEILSGITEGEMIAISGTFTLKAELGKAEAEHAH